MLKLECSFKNRKLVAFAQPFFNFPMHNFPLLKTHQWLPIAFNLKITILTKSSVFSLFQAHWPSFSSLGLYASSIHRAILHVVPSIWNALLYPLHPGRGQSFDCGLLSLPSERVPWPPSQINLFRLFIQQIYFEGLLSARHLYHKGKKTMWQGSTINNKYKPHQVW